MDGTRILEFGLGAVKLDAKGLVDTSGTFRLDGRRKSPYQIRRVTVQLGVMSNADGSCVWTVGGDAPDETRSGAQGSDQQMKNLLLPRCTQVISTVYGPVSCLPRSQMVSEASVQVNLKVTNTCKVRKDVVLVWEREIQNTLKEAILTSLYPRSLVSISIVLNQDDGGVLAACINSATLALLDARVPLKCVPCAGASAIRKTTLDEREVLSNPVASASANKSDPTRVEFMDHKPGDFTLADPDRNEELDAAAVITVVLESSTSKILSINTAGDTEDQEKFSTSVRTSSMLAMEIYQNQIQSIMRQVELDESILGRT
mmetsp:Transcript_2199/g.3969  ORF Transcript_2199/g.3969 Transcript_2199/m.3969 type:complete len:316 (+) Transcript_2199:15-962(+)